MNTNDLYELWYNQNLDDEDLIKELEDIRGNDKEIYERFYSNLEFGTAGLRGVIGVGTNRMNICNIRKVTQGIANYLKNISQKPSVAIGFDGRIKSDKFAIEAAKVLAINGIKVYIYRELMPTPCVSFAVRELKCDAGIMVTASHNPSKYNGYKVFGNDGAQMGLNQTKEVVKEIEKIHIFNNVKIGNFEEEIQKGMIQYIEQDFIEKYLDKVEEQSLNKSLCKNSGFKVVYTPLNGAGNKLVKAIFNRMEVENVIIVKEQELPDGNFPTCPYPNPEVKEALVLGLEECKKNNADLLLATDPDADRLGIAVKNNDGGYELFTGNEVGALLFQYICMQKIKKGIMQNNSILVKTIVSTGIVDLIAKDYGVKVIDVLTGFKFIGEQILLLEKNGEEQRFLLGFEEAYGYLAGTYVRDKDGIVATMLVYEMVAYYKSIGMSLIDARDNLYKKYGADLNTQINYLCEGSEGMEKLKDMMVKIRENEIVKLGDYNVIKLLDYDKSIGKDKIKNESFQIKLPKSNVLCYFLENNIRVIVRPSGTEPKIKVYISINAKTMEEAHKIEKCISEEVKKILGI